MLILALSFMYTLAGCATGQSVDDATRGTIQTQSMIVVAPLNMAVALSANLESSTGFVNQILIDQLSGEGRTVRQLSDRLAVELWIASVNEVERDGGERSFKAAIEAFAELVADHFPFDAIVVPSLYVQNGQVGPRGVHWDTANQPITFVGQSRWKVELPSLSAVLAASIHIYVVDDHGIKIHEKRTGVELIQHLEIEVLRRQGHDKRTWTLADDDPAIEDAVRVRAAIAHSLAPFIPK